MSDFIMPIEPVQYSNSLLRLELINIASVHIEGRNLNPNYRTVKALAKSLRKGDMVPNPILVRPSPEQALFETHGQAYTLESGWLEYLAHFVAGKAYILAIVREETGANRVDPNDCGLPMGMPSITTILDSYDPDPCSFPTNPLPEDPVDCPDGIDGCEVLHTNDFPGFLKGEVDLELSQPPTLVKAVINGTIPYLSDPDPDPLSNETYNPGHILLFTNTGELNLPLEHVEVEGHPTFYHHPLKIGPVARFSTDMEATHTYESAEKIHYVMSALSIRYQLVPVETFAALYPEVYERIKP